MHRPLASCATAAFLLLTGTACANGGGASPPSESAPTSAATLSGRLYFTHTTEGDVQTALVSDAAGIRALTEPGDVCCVLRKSPTEERLLVLPSVDFTPPLTGGTISTAGGPATPLPRTDPDLSLVPSAWSPDGSRIAYEGWDENDPDRTGIYTARASDGADLVRVTELPGIPHDSPLDYSPDGRQLLFFRATHPDPDYTDGSLWVVDVDGTGARQITSTATPPNVWARWSPDGTRILFAAERLADAGPLWTIAPDGSDLETVYQDKDGGFAIAPDWSPDGTKIVLALDPHNDEYAHPPNKVYVINADGTNLQLVNDSNDFKRALEWTD